MGFPFTLYMQDKTRFIDEYPNLWATINKYFPDLNEDDRVKIGSLVLCTCGNCHDSQSGCQCWNDE